ncbi:tripartite tricarboxylate transporter permease [Thermodesulfobacteriota bacterium]
MNAIEGLAYGFSVALAPGNVMVVSIGVILGMLVGVLPGIGVMGAMAILLPIVMALKLDPGTTLIMFAGIYYGGMYGGTITSVLVRVPGEATTVVTCIEGYELAKKGRAGATLAVAAVGSWFGGTVGIIGLIFFAPTLARLALSFGPPEYFALVLLGSFVLSRMVSGSLWRGLLLLSAGLALGSIGMDPVTGTARLTFGWYTLAQGFSIVPVAMGLYGIAEVINLAERAGGLPRVGKVRLSQLFPTRSEWHRSWPAILRGTILGFFWGLLPGPSTILSTFGSYRLEQHLSKYRHEFGHGAIEGVAGPETANNAASTGQFIPLLSLGLPFSPGIAMLLAALLVQGVQPGPLLIIEHPEIFWGVIASMYIGNVALLILNLPLIGVWVSVLRIPQSLLIALILLLCLLGVYSINNSLFDLVVMLVMGMVGYVLSKLRFDASPLVIGLILGPLLESSFRESLYLSRGDPLIFFQRPISVLFIGALFLVLLIPSLRFLISRSR